MQLKWASIAIAMAASMVPSAHAAESVGRTDPLRKVLLDAIRPPIEDDVGVRVQFVVDVLQVEGSWAYFAGTAQRKDGSPINFADTHYAEAMDEGMFDGPTVKALLQRSGSRWEVATFNIGATDVIEGGWPDEFGVSCSVVNFC